MLIPYHISHHSNISGMTSRTENKPKTGCISELDTKAKMIDHVKYNFDSITELSDCYSLTGSIAILISIFSMRVLEYCDREVTINLQ